MINQTTPTVAPTPPMGFLARVATATRVLTTGRGPSVNPLATPPKDRSRASLVDDLTKWCVDERDFWRPVFDRMREEQKFAAGKQWPHNYEHRTGQKEPYIGDVVQQMINRQTASLYAKNPTPEAVLAERMVFEIWEGNQSDIDAAQAIISEFNQVKPQADAAAAAGVPVPAPPKQVGQAMDILRDYQRGMSEKTMLKKVAGTATLLIKQQWGAQSPDMLVAGKQAVSQVLVSRVAYIKAMYRRDMETAPTETANDMEFSDRVATLQAHLRQIEQDETGPDDAKVAAAKLMKVTIQDELAEMQAQQPPPAAGDEGIVHDWLGSTSVIIDRKCTCLREFIGAKRIAHEMMMDPEECEAKFKISLKDAGAKYYISQNGSYKQTSSESFDDTQQEIAAKRMKVCVWEIQDKSTGLCYTICDGVKDFIKEPGANEPEVSRFWSIVPIVFNCQVVEENDPDSDVTIFPRSSVRLAMPMQQDMNTAGEGLREHRVANRPGWIGVKSKFAGTSGQNDLMKLASARPAHEVLMMEGVMPSEKISDFIQAIPTQPIDPKMYDNAQSSQAMMLATGEQPSDLGTQRPDEKATGQNIAAQARATSIGSMIDDLDFAYSALAQMDGEMLLKEMPADTVKALIGRGAAWPDIAREDIAESIFFKIQAGSTGRPNEQADLNNFNVIAPQLGKLMIEAGKSLEPLIKEGVRRLGDKLDVDEFLKPAQVQMPPAPPAEKPKPPTVAISMPFQFLPPEIQQQVEAYAGFKPASPESHLVNKIGHEKAVDAAHHNATISQTGQATAQ